MSALKGKDDDDEATTTTAATATPVTPSVSAAEVFGASLTLFAPSTASSSASCAVSSSPNIMASSTAANSFKSTAVPSVFTYFTSKASSAATSARHLLTAGLLDEALTTLEGAIAITQSALRSQVQQQQQLSQGKSSSSDTALGLGQENIELHESMAPFHYLYGTTLLYVVEESDVMMADNGGGGSDNNDGDNDETQTQDDVEDDDGEEDEHYEEKHEGNDVDDDEEKAKSSHDIKITVSDPAVDLEIAWENLDLARSIINRLVDINNCEEENDDDNSTTTTINGGGGGGGGKTIVYKSNDSSNTNDSSNPQLTLDQRNELLLDLAQVHVRLGDLQRQDDKSESCIADYERALQLRKRVLGVFDKKVADCHFSLGQAYAEAPTRAQERDGRVNDFVEGLGGGLDSGGGQDDDAAGSSSSSTMTNERTAEYRRLSLEHYLVCGHSFSGILATMCDTEYPFRELSTMDVLSYYTLSPVLHAVVREQSKSMTTTDYTKTMLKLRNFVSTLVLPSSHYLSSSHKQSVIEFNNIKEIMDEIQEAMDSAEETECGLRSLSKMKANAKSGGGGGGADEVVGGGGSSDGAVTTIGFGCPNPNVSASVFGSTSIGGGGGTSATATMMTTNGIAASAAPPPTMMIVKKKKKNLVTPKEGSIISGGGDDELSSIKRHKTN